MASAIEDIIDELEEYIDNCKPAAFSSTKIVVNRDDIDGLLEELRAKTPEEIRRYQKIISNKEAILADARAKAESVIAEAQITKNELVSEHQIMQDAYAHANEVVMIASKQAQEILDRATTEANDIRVSAIAYTDELLKSVQDVVKASIDTTRARNETFLNTMQGYLDVVVSNRAELHPETQAAQPAKESAPKESAAKDNAPKENAVKPAEDKPAENEASKKPAETVASADKNKAPAQAAKPSDVNRSQVKATPEGQEVLNIPDEFFKKD